MNIFILNKYRACIRLVTFTVIIVLLCQDVGLGNSFSLSKETFLREEGFERAFKALEVIDLIVKTIGKDKVSMQSLQELGRKPTEEEGKQIFAYAEDHNITIPKSTEDVFKNTHFRRSEDGIWIYGSGWKIRFFHPDSKKPIGLDIKDKKFRDTQELNKNLFCQIYLTSMELNRDKGTIDLSLARDPAYIINDILRVGPRKPIGYLFLDAIGSQQLVGQIKAWVQNKNSEEGTNLKAEIINMTSYPDRLVRCLGNIKRFRRFYERANALYVYDKTELQKLLDNERSNLNLVGIPHDADSFVRYIAKNDISDKTSRLLLLSIFENQRAPTTPIRISERRVKNLISVISDNSRSEKDRMSAINKLCGYNAPDIIHALCGVLNDSAYGVRITAIMVLYALSKTGRFVNPDIFRNNIRNSGIGSYSAWALLHLESNKIDEFSKWLEEQGLNDRSTVAIASDVRCRASGFVFAEDNEYVYLFTNSHVVSTNLKVAIAIGSGEKREWVPGDVVVRYTDTNQSSPYDIAIVAVEKSELRQKGIKLVPIPLINEKQSKEIIGKYIAIVSGFHRVVEPAQIIFGKGNMNLLAAGPIDRIVGGDSGSPVIIRINDKPIVIGMPSGAVNPILPLTPDSRKLYFDLMGMAIPMSRSDFDCGQFVYNDTKPDLFSRVRKIFKEDTRKDNNSATGDGGKTGADIKLYGTSIPVIAILAKFFFDSGILGYLTLIFLIAAGAAFVMWSAMRLAERQLKKENNQSKFKIRRILLKTSAVLGILALVFGTFVYREFTKDPFVKLTRPVTELERTVIQKFKRLALEIETDKYREYAILFVNEFIRNGELINTPLNPNPGSLQAMGVPSIETQKAMVNYGYCEILNDIMLKSYMVHEGNHLACEEIYKRDIQAGRVEYFYFLWKRKTMSRTRMYSEEDLFDRDKFKEIEFRGIRFKPAEIAIAAAGNRAESEFRAHREQFKFLAEELTRHGTNFEKEIKSCDVNVTDIKKNIICLSLKGAIMELGNSIRMDGNVVEREFKERYLKYTFGRDNPDVHRGVMNLEVRRGTMMPIVYGNRLFFKPADPARLFDWAYTGIYKDKNGIQFKIDRVDLSRFPPIPKEDVFSVRGHGVIGKFKKDKNGNPMGGGLSRENLKKFVKTTVKNNTIQYLIDYMDFTGLYYQVGDIMHALGKDTIELAMFNRLFAEWYADAERRKKPGRDMAITEYIKANLSWFIKVFESYRGDDILSQQGLLMLYEAARLKDSRDMPKGALREDLFRVINYFRSIADMTGEEIKESFPQEYFKKIAIQERLWGRRMEIRLIDGCPKNCVFCAVQKYSKMKCMPYPLVVMLAREECENIEFEAFDYEPLYYEDKCGALFHDVAKLFYDYGFITHGYVDEMKDIAQRNLRLIRECPKSGDEEYQVDISIHAADIDYFRLKKKGKKEADIISYYVEHYLSLIKELEGCIIKLRFNFPPRIGKNGKLKHFDKILRKIKRQIIKKLKEEGVELIEEKFLEETIKQKRGTILFWDSQAQILSPRGYIFADQEFTANDLKKIFQQKRFSTDYGFRFYIDSRGMLGIQLTPDFEFSSILFGEHAPADKQYVIKSIFSEGGYLGNVVYVNLLYNIAYLTESTFSKEMLDLLSKLPNLKGDDKRKCAEHIAEIVLNNNLPVPVWSPDFNAINRMVELKIKPEYKRLSLLGIFGDSPRLRYDPIAMQSVNKAGTGEKKGLLDMGERYLELLSAA